jgi:uncharacterized protein
MPDQCEHIGSDTANAEVVRFLASPSSYPAHVDDVQVTETHMSWVFMAGSNVFKMKKPVRSPNFDFTSLSGREMNCREELRLNRRLAPDVYRAVVPLYRGSNHQLSFHAGTDIVEWLVEMRRLPDDRMLKTFLLNGQLTRAHVRRVIDVLADFYHQADRIELDPSVYAGRFQREQRLNREIIGRFASSVPYGRADDVLARLDRALADDESILAERARARRIVEGHGDLRPEHICLCEPVVIFDCLEFSRDLRLVDPFDEIGFLGMECEYLGSRWVKHTLVRRLMLRLDDRPPRRLLALYEAFRAVLRARLTLTHLLDGDVKNRSTWEQRAGRYLALADAALTARLAALRPDRRA